MNSEAERNLRWREQLFANNLAQSNLQLLSTTKQLNTMKKQNNLLIYVSALLLAIVMLLSSCATQKRCNMKYPPKVTIKDSIVIKDSVRIVEKIHHSLQIKDSVVIRDSVYGRDSADCKENSKTIIRRGGDSFTIEVKNGKVFFQYNLEGTKSIYRKEIEKTDSIANYYKGRDSINTHSQEKVVPIPETPKKWYMKVYDKFKDLFALIGVILTLFLVIRFFIRKLILKFS